MTDPALPAPPPTCRDVLQQIVASIDEGSIYSNDQALEAARAALAAPDRVAALPPEVREALQASADWGPMTVEEWRNKWCRNTTVPIYECLANLCSAVLAKYPEVPAERDFEKVLDGPIGLTVVDRRNHPERIDMTVRVCVRNSAGETAWFDRMEDQPDDIAAERAAWVKERDELIAERDRFEAEAERHSLNGVQISLLQAQVAVWQDRAEWCMSQLRGGAS